MAKYLEISDLYIRNVLAEVCNALMCACSPRSFGTYTRGHRVVENEGGTSRQIVAYNSHNGMESESWTVATVVVENPLLVVIRIPKIEHFVDFREPLKALAQAFPIDGVQFVLHYTASDTELANDALVYDMSIRK